MVTYHPHHIPKLPNLNTRKAQTSHVAVAGNIGAGKTTLVMKLAESYGWIPHLEAVDDNPYLADFYEDMHTWAFPLQIYFLHSRFNQVLDVKQANQPVIQDRTIYEDAHIFARNLRQSGYMSERDFENYFSLFESMTSLIEPPDLLIYLRKSLDGLKEQIARRGRSYEQNISTRYLEDLNRNYEEWIANYQKGKLLILDGDNLDYVRKPEDFHFIQKEIERSLSSPM